MRLFIERPIITIVHISILISATDFVLNESESPLIIPITIEINSISIHITIALFISRRNNSLSELTICES